MGLVTVAPCCLCHRTHACHVTRRVHTLPTLVQPSSENCAIVRISEHTTTMPARRRQEMLTDITLSQIPDLSDASVAFPSQNRPLAATPMLRGAHAAEFTLLADDMTGFDLLRHTAEMDAARGEGASFATAPPTPMAPLTVEELTPCAGPCAWDLGPSQASPQRQQRARAESGPRRSSPRKRMRASARLAMAVGAVGDGAPHARMEQLLEEIEVDMETLAQRDGEHKKEDKDGGGGGDGTKQAAREVETDVVDGHPLEDMALPNAVSDGARPRTRTQTRLVTAQQRMSSKIPGAVSRTSSVHTTEKQASTQKEMLHWAQRPEQATSTDDTTAKTPAVNPGTANTRPTLDPRISDPKGAIGMTGRLACHSQKVAASTSDGLGYVCR